MTEHTFPKIEALMADAALGKTEKIEKLRQMEADARARERASTEGMATPSQREGAELKAIESALAALDEPAADPGASSL